MEIYEMWSPGYEQNYMDFNDFFLSFLLSLSMHTFKATKNNSIFLKRFLSQVISTLSKQGHSVHLSP